MILLEELQKISSEKGKERAALRLNMHEPALEAFNTKILEMAQQGRTEIGIECLSYALCRIVPFEHMELAIKYLCAINGLTYHPENAWRKQEAYVTWETK